MNTSYVWGFLLSLSLLLWTAVSVYGRLPESRTMQTIRLSSGRRWFYLIGTAVYLSDIELSVFMKWYAAAFMVTVALVMQLWGIFSIHRQRQNA